MSIYRGNELKQLLEISEAAHAYEDCCTTEIAVELHKVEGYLRKSFLILRELEAYHCEEVSSEDTCKNITNALARDGGYLRARNRLANYSLETEISD